MTKGGWFLPDALVEVGYRRRYSIIKSHYLSGSGADLFDYEHHHEFVNVPLADHLTNLLFDAGAVREPDTTVS